MFKAVFSEHNVNVITIISSSTTVVAVLLLMFQVKIIILIIINLTCLSSCFCLSPIILI